MMPSHTEYISYLRSVINLLEAIDESDAELVSIERVKGAVFPREFKVLYRSREPLGYEQLT